MVGFSILFLVLALPLAGGAVVIAGLCRNQFATLRGFRPMVNDFAVSLSAVLTVVVGFVLFAL